MTFDADICHRRSPENLARLANALREIHARLRGLPPDLPFPLDAKALHFGTNFTFVTDLGDLDTLAEVPPIGTFEELAARCSTFPVKDYAVQVMDLDDLIRVKEHLSRSKDQDALVHLKAAKRVRDKAAGEAD